MKVFVAGATGVLGRRVVLRLSETSDVLALSRTQENEPVIRLAGGTPVQGDLFDAASLAKATVGCDAVVRTATAIPEGMRFRPSHWRDNDRVRRDGTRALLEACRRNDVSTYVQESIVWVATPKDGSAFSEDAPTIDRLWFGSTIDAEEQATQAAKENGIHTATVRFGAFYSADSEQTQTMAAMLRRRRLPVLGEGRQTWSCIHIDDAADALVLVLNKGGKGIFHAVDGHPVTSAEFFDTFADVLGAPKPRRVPRWVGRLVLGRHTLEFLTLSTNTRPARLTKELGWAPKYPTIHDGLGAVVAKLPAAR